MVGKSIVKSTLAIAVVLLVSHLPNAKAQDTETLQTAGESDIQSRESTDPADFGAMVQKVVPGFELTEPRDQSVAFLAEFDGKKEVLRTHPGRRESAVLTKTLTLDRTFNDTPKIGKQRTYLLASVTSEPDRDFRLCVHCNREKLLDKVINRKTSKNGWVDVKVDISRFHYYKVNLELINSDNGMGGFAYWSNVRFVTETGGIDPKGRFQFRHGRVIEVATNKLAIQKNGRWKGGSFDAIFSGDGSHIVIIDKYHSKPGQSPFHYEEFWVYSLETFKLTATETSGIFSQMMFAEDNKTLKFESSGPPMNAVGPPEISGK